MDAVQNRTQLLSKPDSTCGRVKSYLPNRICGGGLPHPYPLSVLPLQNPAILPLRTHSSAAFCATSVICVVPFKIAIPCPTWAVFYPVFCINWLTFYLNLHNTETSCFFCKWISGVIYHKQKVFNKNTYNLLKLWECSFCTCVPPLTSRHHPSSEGVKWLCRHRSFKFGRQIAFWITGEWGLSLAEREGYRSVLTMKKNVKVDSSFEHRRAAHSGWRPAIEWPGMNHLGEGRGPR